MPVTDRLAARTDARQPPFQIAKEIKSLRADMRKNDAGIEVFQDMLSRTAVKQAAALSQASYCKNVRNMEWNCGKACSAIPDLKIHWTHGDNNDTPYAIVASSTALEAVLVAHAGSNFDSIGSYLTDADISRDPPDKKLVPDDLANDIKVHGGFHDLWLESSDAIRTEVIKALKMTGFRTVTLTGHSLGAALVQMDAVYLRSSLSESITVQNLGFAIPRVGNQAWADHVDKVLGLNQAHFINNDDLVPHVPKFGYKHPSNEIWISEEGIAFYCQGQENEVCAQSVEWYSLSIASHEGPYFGITITSARCE